VSTEGEPDLPYFMTIFSAALDSQQKRESQIAPLSIEPLKFAAMAAKMAVTVSVQSPTGYGTQTQSRSD
jgi:hypothetical protein